MKVSVARAVRAGWQPSSRQLGAWAQAAVGRAGEAAGLELSVLIAGPARSRRLNAHYRGLDHATNVLSFPMPTQALRGASAPVRLLGELVICPAILRREARAQRKPLRAHWAHMVVHGVLHLIGLNHERTAQARRMERREVRVLRRLGFPNPYRTIARSPARNGNG